jgi:hypothetical protein
MENGDPKKWNPLVRFQPIFDRKQKDKPRAIPLQTASQIAHAVKQNLSNLKLSVMSPLAIKIEAERVADQYGVPKKAKREFYKISKSKNWRGKNKGRDIVKSAATLSSSMNWMKENENRGTGIDTVATRIRRRSPPK